MQYYDLSVKATPSSVEEMARFAKELGFSGIVVVDDFQGIGKLDDLKKAMSSIKIEDFEIYTGAQIQAQDRNELREKINIVRNNVEVLLVSGGNYHINRAACEDSRVDVLMNPEKDRRDIGLDEPVLRAAAKNNVAIGIGFNEILINFRKNRSRLFRSITQIIDLCDHYNVKVVMCSSADYRLGMRDPRELVSILNVLGSDLPKAFSAVSDLPKNIVEKNRKILSGERFGEIEEIEGDTNG